MSDPPAPTRRTYAAAALGVAAFVAYASWVPFTFHAVPWDAATDAFARCMTGRAAVTSRSDGLVNVLVAVPLGYALLGACRADRGGVKGDVAAGLALLPACLGLAVGVEFGQVFIPSRTCAGSDVWCQGVGAALGMALWVGAGRTLTAHARVVWGRTHAAGAAGRLLPAYLALLAVIQALPLDLTPGPKDLYKKVRDEARFVPLGEFRGADGDGAWAAAAKILKLAGLYLPAGLLAARLPGRFWASGPRVALAAVGLGVALESIQVAVHSRTPAATDALAGAAGAVVGWAIGRRWRGGVGPGAALGFGTLWAAALLAAYWEPFHFRDPPGAFDWLPGMPLESGNPLSALEEMLTKLVLFAPAGVLVAATCGCRGGWVVAAAAGGIVSAVIEVGQLYLRTHTPCVTDVLLGGVGAVAGAWAAGRVSEAGGGTFRPGVY